MDDRNEFDLDRFLNAQEDDYATALSELRRGQKRSHWIWFVFPQLKGLGLSATSEHFGIKNLAEARAYVDHPVLGPRLLECCNALLSVQGRSASEIMGYPDDLKLRSSMTLFSIASPSHKEFHKVLQQFYNGEEDDKTRRLLGLD